MVRYSEYGIVTSHKSLASDWLALTAVLVLANGNFVFSNWPLHSWSSLEIVRFLDKNTYNLSQGCKVYQTSGFIIIGPKRMWTYTKRSLYNQLTCTLKCYKTSAHALGKLLKIWLTDNKLIWPTRRIDKYPTPQKKDRILSLSGTFNVNIKFVKVVRAMNR